MKPAASEFADTEQMMEAAERLYGPYRWERYDLLVLPPSFPFGGMENPRLTFATPTILAGDRSLVSLVAHELAHSWSGNLVTNATWRDFWLNEGFTTYIERRIMEEVYGARARRDGRVLGRQDLEKEIAGIPNELEILHIDLRGRDPDDGFTDVPYEKGALFAAPPRGGLRPRALRRLPARLLRPLRLPEHHDGRVPARTWTSTSSARLRIWRPASRSRSGSSLPGSPPPPRVSPPRGSRRSRSSAAAGWRARSRRPRIPAQKWTTHEWLHFLRTLPSPLPAEKMAELDRAFGLTRARNAEVAHQWLLMAVRGSYEAAYPRLEEFLTSHGPPQVRQAAVRGAGEDRGRTRAGRSRSTARPGPSTTRSPCRRWMRS